MAFPSSNDSFTEVDGTTLFSGVDHANFHNTLGSAVVALEQKMGLGGATPTTANKILVSSAVGTTTWAPIWTNGSIATGTVVTSLFTSGTINNSVIGTPAITGGTVTSSVLRGSYDGWISVSDTWTYASATTITVPSDATALYDIGDRIKLTQTSVKYFVVTAVAATTLTVTGGSDYTVANAAISAISYSKVATPHSYPHWYNWGISYTFDGTAPTGATENTGKFNVIGRTCFFRTKAAYGTAGDGCQNIYYALPITPVGSASQYTLVAHGALAGAATFPTMETKVMVYGTASDSLYIKAGTALALTHIYTDGFYEI